MNQEKRVNYFIVNGEKYYTGTVFITKSYNIKPIKAAFVYYNTEYETYRYKELDNGCLVMVDKKDFEQQFVRVTGEIDTSVNMPEIKYLKDSQVNGMPVGWLWYIVLMLFGVLVKGQIIWWIFISIVFFSWRSKKMNKEGTYIEW